MFCRKSLTTTYARKFKTGLLLIASLCMAYSPPACSEKLITLNEATSRAREQHPELKIFSLRSQELEGLKQTAELSPPLELALEAENFLGSGDYTDLDSTEATLSLSSVIELGEKAKARTNLVQSQSHLLQVQQQIKALDILATITQSFITALSLQEKLSVAKDAAKLTETSVGIVRKRVNSGAAHEAELLRAVADHHQNRLRLESLQAQFDVSKVSLAASWGGMSTDFDGVAGDLFHFSLAPSFEQLYQRALTSPAIDFYASQERVYNAELQMARSRSNSNLRWQIGVKHFSASGDNALTAGLSIPLFSGRRSSGNLRAANAAIEKNEYEREAALLSFRTRLFEAWRMHQQNAQAVKKIQRNILPTLNDALLQIQNAYEQGGYSYLEWEDAQHALLSARFALIDQATQALLNHALIEQLTGEPLVE